MKKNKITFLLPLILISGHVFAEEADLQERLSKLERMVDNRGLLNILKEMESLQQEVRELRGEVEQQAYTIDQMEKRQKNLYNDLDQRLQSGQNSEQSESVVEVVEDQPQPREQPKVAPMPVEEDLLGDLPEDISVAEKPVQLPDSKPESNSNKSGNSSSVQPVETYVAKQKNPNSPTENSSVNQPQTDLPDSDPAPSNNQVNQADQSTETTAGSADEEGRYSEAFTLLKQGHHDKAVKSFRDFLQQHPNSKYADNAQYWLGESYYAKRRFEEAITEYKELLNRFPDSGKASHAQLKVGYCYDELGQADFAQGELEDLIARFPGTSAANLAEERLAQIRTQ